MTDARVPEPSDAASLAALRAGWRHRHRDVSGGWLRPTVFGALAIGVTYAVGSLIGASVR